MNALYVTVSIPLLLLLAGFNHAHGLTTFGKSQNNQQNTPPPIPAKSCTNHETCKGMNGTSCVRDLRSHVNRNLCLCGNNQPPNNGICPYTKKEPFHVCNRNEDCSEGAKCEISKTEQSVRVCICEDHPEFTDCNSARRGNAASTLALLLSLLITSKWITSKWN